MTSSRNGVAVWFAAALSLAACSDDETIVSLNVSFTNVSSADTLRVEFKQAGEDTFLESFTPPTVTTEADDGTTTTSLKSPFYERITLPESWASGTASIKVDALDGSGDPILDAVTGDPISGTTTAEVEEMETVAAYVTLAAEPPPPEPTAGAAGETGSAGATAGAPAGAGTAGVPGGAGGTAG